MENNKKIIITVLSVLVVAIAVGYALLAQELTINGSASIDSTWRVEITNIASKDVVGDAVNKTDPSYTATTANFSVGFTQPGDSITYDITVTNKGTLDAVVESITVNKGDNPAITYTTSGLKRGDKIAKNNGTNTLTVKVDYDSSVTSQPASTTNNITVTINYQQDLGQVPITYEAYSIGDIIHYKNSDWYVIKNSSTTEDYVTLMKAQILTYEELGNNYALSNNENKYDKMAYYWSDTCHDNHYTYGTQKYESYISSGCNGHNDYDGSKVKEMLETRYLPTLEVSNLKEINGYKIRLITRDELTNDLGCQLDGNVTNVYYSAGPSTPAFVYNQKYWTMTNGDNGVWAFGWNDRWMDEISVYSDYGVRPVINLLKSAIQ